MGEMLLQRFVTGRTIALRHANYLLDGNNVHPTQTGALMSERAALIDELVQLEPVLMRARFAAQPPPLLDIDVTMLQFKAMIIMLCVAGESDAAGARISDLARWLNATPATASILVDRLVDRNLVERREDPLDRRQHRCRLTAEGEQIVVRFLESTRSQTRELLETLSEEELETVLESTKIMIEATERVRATTGGPGVTDCPVTEEALQFTPAAGARPASV
jgi:DNA-binding MarR family transcriptional regulator